MAEIPTWEAGGDEEDSFFGFFPLPEDGKPVTNELIDRIRGDELY